jgi:antitoxin ParD1/3/4
MVVMHISLTPELETKVKAKVESGMYNNASEVIREAIPFMDTHANWIKEVKLAHLRKQLDVGITQLDNDQGIAIKSKSALDKLFEDITKI